MKFTFIFKWCTTRGGEVTPRREIDRGQATGPAWVKRRTRGS
ncbi:hypothetical protein [Sorangium sp. So ce388]